MANPATTVDVASRWHPLDTNETTVAQTYLDTAWVMLKRKIDGIEALVADDPDLEVATVHVLATAVLRVLKNPDGLKSESVDDHSADWNADAASGSLFFTDDELSDLAPGEAEHGRAFMIDPLGDYAARLAE